MSKYEEAIKLKEQLANYEKIVTEIFERIQWTLPPLLAKDGTEIESTQTELEIFNRMLSAVKKLQGPILADVTDAAHRELRYATEEAWAEMSELFKEFTMDLRSEVDQLKAKIEEKPAIGVMP